MPPAGPRVRGAAKAPPLRVAEVRWSVLPVPVSQAKPSSPAPACQAQRRGLTGQTRPALQGVADGDGKDSPPGPWRARARTLTTTPVTRGHGMASKTPANRATAPRHERPARPKARYSTEKLQARQAAPGSRVRPESGTPARKTGHKAHTGTI